MIYLIFLCIIILMLILGLDKHVKLNTYIKFPLIFLTIITGLRYKTGSDLANYELVFDWVSYGRYTDYEISYTFICKFVQLIHGKFQLVVLIYAVISYFCIYKALNNFCKSKYEVAIFICFFYSFMFSTYFTLMRQFLAASILLYAFSIDKENNIKRYFCFVLAGLSHYGGFLVIPFYFILDTKLFNKNWKRVLALGIVILLGRGLFSLEIMSRLVGIFNRYNYYTDKSNYGTLNSVSVIIMIMTFIYVIFLIIYIKRDYNKSGSALIMETESKGILLTFIIYFSTIMIGWFHRSYWYTNMFVGFLPVWTASLFPEKQGKNIYLGIWIAFILLYSVYYFLALPELQPNMFPYKWSLDLF